MKRRESDRLGNVTYLTPEDLKARGAWRTEFPEGNLPSWFDKAWMWLHKKKTIIGTSLTAIGYGITHITPWGWIVVGVGTLFGSTGIIHKIFKGQTVYGEHGTFGEVEFKNLSSDISKAIKAKDWISLILLAIAIIVSLVKGKGGSDQDK